MVSINELWLAVSSKFNVQLHLWKCIPRRPSQLSLICMVDFC